MAGIHDNIDICPLVPSYNYWKLSGKWNIGKNDGSKEYRRYKYDNRLLSLPTVTPEEGDAYKRIIHYLNYKELGENSLKYIYSVEQFYDGSDDEFNKLLKNENGYINLAMKNVYSYYLFCFCMLAKIDIAGRSGVNWHKVGYTEAAQYSLEKMFAISLFEYETRLVADEVDKKMKHVNFKERERTQILLKLVSTECWKIFKEIYEAPGVFNRFILAENVIPEIIGSELEKLINSYSEEEQECDDYVMDVEQYIQKMLEKSCANLYTSTIEKIKRTNQHYINTENIIYEIESCGKLKRASAESKRGNKSFYEDCYAKLILYMKDNIHEDKAEAYVISNRQTLRAKARNFVSERKQEINIIESWVISSSFYLTKKHI